MGPGPVNHLHIAERRYDALVGVGGIGSGSVFAIDGAETLGREESRGGRFLDRRDYCKLHIIAHYVQTLLGPGFQTIPVGRVGDDEDGARLLREMEEAGLRTERVTEVPGRRTLFSFCFVYPDGSGGNLTTTDSASSTVDAGAVAEAEGEFARFGGRGIALAAPEVPLEARAALVAMGARHDFFCATSFTSQEMRPAMEAGMLAKVDLLAINVNEAAAAAGVDPAGEPSGIVEAGVEALGEVNPAMMVSVTAGVRGSWSWNGVSLGHAAAADVEPVSTAGAGDAHFAGVLAGLTAGLTLPEAQELGALVAGLSVRSPHTIDPSVDRDSLRAFADAAGMPLSPEVRTLLENG